MDKPPWLHMATAAVWTLALALMVLGTITPRDSLRDWALLVACAGAVKTVALLAGAAAAKISKTVADERLRVEQIIALCESRRDAIDYGDNVRDIR